MRPGSRTVGAPPRSGRRVRLRSVEPPDIDFLYGLYTAEETGFRWVLRGATPDPMTLRERIFAGVLAQFVVEADRTRAPIGLVTAYNANHSSGYVYFAVVVDAQRRGDGCAVEAASLFCNYLFAVWPFRLIYAEGIEFNFAQFGSALGRYFTPVARLPQREFFDGVYWDWIVAQLTREDWQALLADDAIPGLKQAPHRQA